jgi:hypothetical protein
VKAVSGVGSSIAGKRLLLAVFGCASVAAHAELFDTPNDVGSVGLLQTPTARFADDGEFRVGISHVLPYNQAHFTAQALPWFETTFRYTDVTNVPYGPESFSGKQTYKDRSFGFKMRLLQEGEYWPAVALGVQDFGGTGVFDAEYLVASRRYYDVDFSLGLGWGRLGAASRLHNPLGLISAHFNQAQLDIAGSTTTTPGGAGLGRLFTGTVGPFGGVQWHTPIPGVSVVIEYDENDYQHEALGIRLPQKSHINGKLDYEPWSGTHLGLGYERGDTLTFNVDFGVNFEKFRGIPKLADPPLPPVKLRDETTPDEPDAAEAPPDISQAQQQQTVEQLRTELMAQSFNLVAVNFNASAHEIEVWLRQDRYNNPSQVVGRTARILTATAPEQIERFTVINRDEGVETYRITVQRRDFEKLATGQISPEEILLNSEIVAPKPGEPEASFRNLDHYPRFGYDMGPGVRQQIGGPDGFYFGQLLWHFNGDVAVSDHLSFSGELGINIINNFDGLTQPSNSSLPHVRSDIVQYLKHGQNSIDQLETDYIWSPANEVYARFSAGIFEDMYSGIASELLYRPFGKRWAVGFDVNHVWQRAFDERFDLLGYNVTTGFVTLYYDFPIYNLIGSVSVGRYLARDRGATVNLGRHFSDGVVVGAFVTKTNVSAAQFGEGSFDKGIYIVIPFDVFFTESSRENGTLVYRPLTRDGGQRARDGKDLFSATGSGDLGHINESWPEVAH